MNDAPRLDRTSLIISVHDGKRTIDEAAALASELFGSPISRNVVGKTWNGAGLSSPRPPRKDSLGEEGPAIRACIRETWLGGMHSTKALVNFVETKFARPVGRNIVDDVVKYVRRAAKESIRVGSCGMVQRTREGREPRWSDRDQSADAPSRPLKPYTPEPSAREQHKLDLRRVITEPEVPEPETPGYSFDELPEGGCKWPVNAPPVGQRHLMCGAPRLSFGSPYCQCHQLRGIYVARTKGRLGL